MELSVYRQIDSLIAEHIFGWRPVYDNEGYWVANLPDGSRHRSDYLGNKYDSRTGKKLKTPKWWEALDSEIPWYHYEMSDTPSSSWLLIQTMMEQGWTCTLARDEKSGTTTCTFSHGKKQASATDASTALAICLSALLAKNINLENKLKL